MEEWRTIPDWPRYEVSNKGSVRRSTTVGGLPINPPRILSASLDTGGYPMVVLRDGARSLTACIHRLVLWAFVGPKPTGQECRHLNGKRNDNRLENLKWGTRLENHRDAVMHGTAVEVSGNRGIRKLRPEHVLEIRATYYSRNCGRREFAARYGVSEATVKAILSGRIWPHI